MNSHFVLIETMIGSKILLVVLVIAISDNVVGQFTQNSPGNSMTAAQQAKLMSMIRARNMPQQQSGKIIMQCVI